MKITEEQQKDVDSRVASFRDDYIALTKKYEVDFICFPQWIQTNDGTFVTVPQMQIVDKKYLPVPSPLTKEQIIQEK